MSHRTAGLLIVGWLLGLLTAFMWPTIATERQTVVVTDPAGYGSSQSPDMVAQT